MCQSVREYVRGEEGVLSNILFETPQLNDLITDENDRISYVYPSK